MFVLPALRPGDPARFERLAVYPLFGNGGPALNYLLSDEALGDGTARVEEATEGGSVPHLAVTVTADRPVLFLEGEELRGAKQNRVLNTSVLVAAQSRAVLPVSCVEQGRWRYTSRQFGSSGTHASYKLRKLLKESVTRSARDGRGHDSDQGSVWAEVTRQMHSLQASSGTSAMSDTFEAHRDRVAAAQAQLAYVEGATGLAVAIGGRIVSVDVFDAAGPCRKAWARLLSGLVLDAAEDPAGPGEPAAADALAVLRDAPWQAVPAAAAGEEYRAEAAGGRWHGSVLASGGRVIHGSLVLAG